MDQKPTENADIQELIRISQISRSHLSSEFSTLKHRIDVPSRIMESFTQKPSAWLLGGLASGMVASLFFRRGEPRTGKSRGFSQSLIALTLTAAQPFIKAAIAKLIQEWATKAITRSQSSQSLFNPLQDSTHVRSPGSGSR
jgi:hypothetical protein